MDYSRHRSRDRPRLARRRRHQGRRRTSEQQQVVHSQLRPRQDLTQTNSRRRRRTSNSLRRQTQRTTALRILSIRHTLQDSSHSNQVRSKVMHVHTRSLLRLCHQDNSTSSPYSLMDLMERRNMDRPAGLSSSLQTSATLNKGRNHQVCTHHSRRTTTSRILRRQLIHPRMSIILHRLRLGLCYPRSRSRRRTLLMCTTHQLQHRTLRSPRPSISAPHPSSIIRPPTPIGLVYRPCIQE
jgi:hypothetical protein